MTALFTWDLADPEALAGYATYKAPQLSRLLGGAEQAKAAVQNVSSALSAGKSLLESGDYAQLTGVVQAAIQAYTAWLRNKFALSATQTRSNQTAAQQALMSAADPKLWLQRVPVEGKKPLADVVVKRKLTGPLKTIAALRAQYGERNAHHHKVIPLKRDGIERSFKTTWSPSPYDDGEPSYLARDWSSAEEDRLSGQLNAFPPGDSVQLALPLYPYLSYRGLASKAGDVYVDPDVGLAFAVGAVTPSTIHVGYDWNAVRAHYDRFLEYTGLEDVPVHSEGQAEPGIYRLPDGDLHVVKDPESTVGHGVHLEYPVAPNFIPSEVLVYVDAQFREFFSVRRACEVQFEHLADSVKAAAKNSLDPTMAALARGEKPKLHTGSSGRVGRRTGRRPPTARQGRDDGAGGAVLAVGAGLAVAAAAALML